MLQSLLSLLKPENVIFIPAFLLMISILVAAHEYGHYLLARAFGMGVEEFAIGFGKKPLWVYARKKYLLTTESGQALEESTDFTVRPWPLGGFVRIKGMLPEDDGSEVQVPGGFYSKAPWKRFIVLLAGPVFSVIAGVALLTVLYATAGDTLPTKKPIIGGVAKGEPADLAGLKEGDEIVSVDGKPIPTFYDLILNVRNSPGKKLNLVYERAGKRLNTNLVVKVDPKPSPVIGPDLSMTGEYKVQGKMGAGWKTETVRLPLGTAFSKAVGMPVKVLGALATMFKQPTMMKEAVGGPVSMLAYTRAAVSVGFASLVELAAGLSISVGIFNLLPIPPLDGGQMAIAAAEMVRRGRRLSMKVQNTVALAGMALVLTMVVLVLFVDIQRFTGPQDVGLKTATPAAGNSAK